jgi:hypothetical protein
MSITDIAKRRLAAFNARQSAERAARRAALICVVCTKPLLCERSSKRSSVRANAIAPSAVATPCASSGGGRHGETGMQTTPEKVRKFLSLVNRGPIRSPRSDEELRAAGVKIVTGEGRGFILPSGPPPSKTAPSGGQGSP